MNLSEKQKDFLKKRKKEKRLIILIQILLIISFFLCWELCARKGIINSFIYSSPSKIVFTIRNLLLTHNLWQHILTTLWEVLIAFLLGTTIGFMIAIIFYLFPLTLKIFEPFLTLLNSMPKVALGPLIIIIIGANQKSIIVMALLINIIVNITTIYNGFITIDDTKLKLFKSYHASKYQILKYLVIPNAYPFIISSLKLNIALTLIGGITGEFLVSQKGIGYLIIYGTQVFNLNLVMSGIVILMFISFVIYKLVMILEKKLLKKYH